MMRGTVGLWWCHVSVCAPVLLLCHCFGPLTLNVLDDLAVAGRR